MVRIGGCEWESVKELREFLRFTSLSTQTVEEEVALFREYCKHPGWAITEETRYNQAWLRGYCMACEQVIGRAYCARPGYGLSGAEELPNEAYDWHTV